MYLICDSLPLAGKKFYRSVFEDAFLRHANQAIERRPAHQPRISVVLFAETGLPDARVRTVPPFNQLLAEAEQCLLHRGVKLAAIAGILRGCVDHFAINVELRLFARGVSDPYRPRIKVSA